MDQIPCKVDDPAADKAIFPYGFGLTYPVPQGTNTVSSAETLVLYNPFRVEAVLVATSPG